MEVMNGVIGVDDVLQGKRIKDATRGLSKRFQDRNPFLAVQLALTTARKITNPKFDWFFKDEMPYWDKADGDVTGGTTSIDIPVTNGQFFVAGDVVYFPTATLLAGETAYGVVTNVSGVTVSVTSFVSDGTPTGLMNLPSLATDDEIFNYADSQTGWGGPPTNKIVKDIEFTNFPQFLRAPFSEDVWMSGQDIYTDSSQKNESSKEQHDAIRRRMEQVAIWGEKGERTLGESKQYFAAGLKQQIATGAPENMINLPDGWDEDDLDAALLEGPGKAGVGSNKRFWFLGTQQFLRLSSIMKGKERIVQTDVKVAGIHFRKYMDPGGKTYYLTVHNSFEGPLAYDSLIIDPAQIRIRNYKEQGVLTLHSDIQNRDNPGHQSEWRSIFSIMLMNPHSAAYVHQEPI
jgi:hypothetical protein